MQEGAQLKESDYINIGTALTLSIDSQHGPIGRTMFQAYNLFFDSLNSRGGANISGQFYPVKLTLIDDESNADRVENITRFLVETRGIQHLLGPYGSELSEPAAEVAHEYGAVMVTPIAGLPSVYKDRPRVFGTVSPSNQQLASAIECVAAKGAVTIGYIQEDLEYTKDTCASLQPLAAKHNLLVKFGTTVPANASLDVVGNAIAQMKKVNPDVVVGCVDRDVCHRILRETAVQSFDVKAMILTICVTLPGFFESLETSVGFSLGSFMIGPTAWHPSLRTQSIQTGVNQTWTLAEFWYASYRQVIPYQAVSAFAAASTLVRGMEIAGTTEPAEVAEALQNMDEVSVLGRIKFDDQGQNMEGFMAVQISGSGVISVVAPAEVAQRDVIYPKPELAGLPCFNNNRWRIGSYGLSPDGKCLKCAEHEIAPYNESAGGRVCQPKICPEGTRSFIFRSLVIRNDGAYCQMCHAGQYAAQPGASQCETCEAGSYQDEHGQSFCKLCPPGKVTDSWGQESCMACSPGKYADSYGSSNCKACPRGADCNADQNGLFSNFTNKPGWFVFVPEGTDYSNGRMYRCIHGTDGSACVPGGCWRDKEGQETAVGPFCGRCRKGFGWNIIHGRCSKCPRTSESLVICVIAVLLVVASACLVLFLVLLTDFTRPRNVKAIVFKQFFNYLSAIQVVISSSQLWMPFGISLDIESIFRWFATIGIGGPPFATKAGHCLAEELTGFEDAFRVYSILGFLTVPLVMMGCVAGFYMHRNYCYFLGNKPPKQSRLLTCMVIFAFVIHPLVTDLNLAAFKCHYFDQQRLVLDTTVICNSDEHRKWEIMGFIGFVLFSLGIPYATYSLLRKYKKAGKLSNRKTINTLGFLYSGFEPEYYYFESWLMVRKVMYQFVGIVIIPGMTSAQQDENRVFDNMTLLVLAITSLGVHIYCQPYDNRSYFILDRVESASLWAVLFTLVVQIFLFVTDESYFFSDQKARWDEDRNFHRDIRDFTCTGIVIFVNGRFFLLALYVLFRKQIEDKIHWRCMDYGAVMVETSGLKMENISRTARRSFTVMFDELADMFVEHESGVNCLEFFSCLKYMCVDALYHRYRDELVQTGAGLDEVIDIHHELARANWRQALHLQFLYAQHRLYVYLLNSCETFQRWARRLAFSDDLENPKERIERKRKALVEELDRLKKFNAQTLEHCQFAKFSVEELHLSMLRISKELTKEVKQNSKKLEKKLTTQSIKQQGEEDEGIAARGKSFTTIMSRSQITAMPRSATATLSMSDVSTATASYPSLPDVDLDPDVADAPMTLAMAHQLEQHLRIEQAEMPQLREKIANQLALKEAQVAVAQEECEAMELSFRQELEIVAHPEKAEEKHMVVEDPDEEDLIDDDEEENDNLENEADIEMKLEHAVGLEVQMGSRCWECNAETLDHERFCWNCGQLAKCTWKNLEAMNQRSLRAALTRENEEKQEELRKLQERLNETTFRTGNQKSELDHNKREMQAFEAAWKRNLGKLKALEKESEEIQADFPAYNAKLKDAEARLFAMTVELDKKLVLREQQANGAAKQDRPRDAEEVPSGNGLSSYFEQVLSSAPASASESPRLPPARGGSQEGTTNAFARWLKTK